jgi:TonB-dependent SusC/RagA subfamily outer membrane receptor
LVNLTAVSYNNQFKKDIRVPQLPYMANYKSRSFLKRNGFETDGDYILDKKYLLGKNKSWITAFHLDTMPYYQLLFPKESFHDAVTLTEEVYPQVSVNVVKNGVPQEIYLLYLNRNLVYFNGVTDRAHYSFIVMPENVHIGIRLKDQFLEIDSLYIQPHYKHDLSFDLDNLPPHSKLVPAEKFWTVPEKDLLEKTMLRMKNNYNNLNAFLWQGNSVTRINNPAAITGPFEQSPVTFYKPGQFDISFQFEPGYEYSLTKQVARLEKKELFPDRKYKYMLPYYAQSFLKLGDTIISPPEIIYGAAEKTRFLKTSGNAYEHASYASRKMDKGRIQFSINNDSISRYEYIVLKPNEYPMAPLILNGSYQYMVSNVDEGTYTLYLVTRNFNTQFIENIRVLKNGTTCIKLDSVRFMPNNPYIMELADSAERSRHKTIVEPIPDETYSLPDNAIYQSINGSSISGKITDSKGNRPIPFAQVMIKGSRTGTLADANGNFNLNSLRWGKHILVASAVGYMSHETVVDLSNGTHLILAIKLQVSSMALQEVVVTSAYGIKRSLRSLSFSVSQINADDITVVNRPESVLAGKISGVFIKNGEELFLDSARYIRIRGENGLGAQDNPVYVIDGIMYKELPKGFNLADATDITILKDAEATALYGQAGANGVIVITTQVKTFRSEFLLKLPTRIILPVGGPL